MMIPLISNEARMDVTLLFLSLKHSIHHGGKTTKIALVLMYTLWI